MKWISFKDERPPYLADLLVWDASGELGGRCGLGWIPDDECDHNDDPLLLTYNAEDVQELLLTDVINGDFYWMLAPKHIMNPGCGLPKEMAQEEINKQYNALLINHREKCKSDIPDLLKMMEDHPGNEDVMRTIIKQKESFIEKTRLL